MDPQRRIAKEQSNPRGKDRKTNTRAITGSPYNKGPNHGLLGSLTKSPKEILATEKAAKAFDPPPCMASKSKNRGTTKYCYFHEDFGHETNNYREMKKQIEEAVK